MKWENTREWWNHTWTLLTSSSPVSPSLFLSSPFLPSFLLDLTQKNPLLSASTRSTVLVSLLPTGSLTCLDHHSPSWNSNHHHGKVVTSKATRPMQLSMGVVPHFSKKTKVFLLGVASSKGVYNMSPISENDRNTLVLLIGIPWYNLNHSLKIWFWEKMGVCYSWIPFFFFILHLYPINFFLKHI